METTEFYKGCIVPISIKAGEGINKDTKVQLFINEQDKGFIQTSPFIYYWQTNELAAGSQTIKAIYPSPDNPSVVDEQSIEILVSDVSCPDEVIDIDGNTYPVVQIGNQCWMQTKLQTTHYPDGEPLLNGIDSLVGGLPNELPGWYFAYDRDSAYAKTYGYLYTWTTIMKGNNADDGINQVQGICPDGWHTPDVNEWRALIDFSGGIDVAGGLLKDTVMFGSTALLENAFSHGFNARPGGCRVSDGSYIEESSSAYFYTATETIPNHAYHILISDKKSKAAILGHQDSKRFGYSVRCVKN